MGLDDTAGELDIFSVSGRTVITSPLSPNDDLVLIPVIQYKASQLNWKDTPLGFPIEDEDLHAISLITYGIYNREGSPWIIGGWASAEMATDFQHVNGDDFTFDIVAGVAYKFSDTLKVGMGVAALNLNNDEEFLPAPILDWRPTSNIRIGVLGADTIASYRPSDDWEFSLRSFTAGDEWNIRDAAGRSTTLDFSSYRVGLYVDRRLTGDLWLRVGGGMTVLNEIELKSPHGKRSYKDDLDEGWFGEIAIHLDIW